MRADEISTLALVAGTTRVNLLEGNRGGRGIALQRITHGMNGRESVTEVYELSITATSTDMAIRIQQRLLGLLLQSVEYYNSDVESEPVYLEARARGETNSRYALITNYQWSELVDPYSETFGTAYRTSMLDLSIGITRSPWMSYKPGTGVTVGGNSFLPAEPFAGTTIAVGVASAGFGAPPVKASNGYLFFGTTTTEIIRSINDGVTWVNLGTISGATALNGLTEHGGQLYMAGSSIYKSTDLTGTSWSLESGTSGTTFHSIASGDHVLYAGADGEIWKRIDGGSWAVDSTGYDGSVVLIFVTSTGAVLHSDKTHMYYNAQVAAIEDTGNASNSTGIQMVELSDRLVMVGDNGTYISRDDGLSWAKTGFQGLQSIGAVSPDVLLGGGLLDIYMSHDRGQTWAIHTFFTATAAYFGFLEAGGRIHFGRLNQNYSIPDFNDDLTGMDFSTGALYPSSYALPTAVANFNHRRPLTHFKRYDASAGTYDTFERVPTGGTSFFPASVAVGDIAYFGIEIPSDIAYRSLYIDLSASQVGLTLAVEVWNGSAWASLPTLEVGENVKILKKPGLMLWPTSVTQAATTIDSVNANWIRFRVTAVDATHTVPEFNNVFVVNTGFVGLPAAGGDMPALATIELRNATAESSDEDTNRLYMALRSVERGSDFTAYLIPNTNSYSGRGLSFSHLGNVTWPPYANTAVGVAALTTAIPGSLWYRTFTITMAPDLAAQYYGTYRIFVRNLFIGTAGETKIRLIITTGSGSYERVGLPVTLIPDPGDSHFRLTEVGLFTISEPRQLKASELGDSVAISVEIYRGGGAGAGDNVAISDIILLPADEYIGEFADVSGGNGGAGRDDVLSIDSITNPKRALRSLVRSRGGRLVKSAWQSNSSGPLTLQPNGTQRLWLLSESWDSVRGEFISVAHVHHEVDIMISPRYIGLRGNA